MLHSGHIRSACEQMQGKKSAQLKAKFTALFSLHSVKYFNSFVCISAMFY
jgi:hypothetical protein